MKYTIEQLAEIVEIYKETPTLETVNSLAKHYDIPPRSIIAKLSSMGIYKKKEYTNKRGETPTRKEEYIERISTMLDIDLALLDSMEKVTKMALVKLDERIQALIDPKLH